jgi:3-hydroxyisobutyrate dehydrogenase
MKPITPKDANLGFIGIGYMGRRIAQRLLEAGFSLKAYDRTRVKAEDLVPYGGVVVDDIAEVASSSDVLLSCLSNDEAVLGAHLGPQGSLSNVRRGTLVIEMSTVSPETAKRIAQHASHRDIPVSDVTISGSTTAAEEGALVLFGGGDESCFQAAKSIFRAIARRYFYMGPNGSEATTKLVVNALLGIGMQAIAEAVALGEKSGLERSGLLQVLSQTAVVPPAHIGKLQRAMNNDYNPQFPLRLMNKDFGLILRFAAAVGARMPATEAAFEINSTRLTDGQEEDFSSVILEMEKQDDLLAVQET